MLAALALRNLFRNRRRTMLSMVVIGVGVVSLLLTLGFIRYSFDGLSDAIIRGGLAHLEVAPASVGDGTGNPIIDRAGSPPAFHGWQAVRDRIESRADVQATSAAVQLAGVLLNGDRSMAFMGAAVEPARQRSMGIAVKLRAGEALPDDAPVAGDDRVLLGVDLARALHVEVGDSIVAMVGTAAGTLNAVDLTVAGIFTTGLQELDARMAQMHLATAQRLMGTDDVTSLLVGLKDRAATETVARAIREDVATITPALTVADWESRAPFYRQVRGLYIGIFVFLGTIIGLLVCLSASNTFQMSVLERVREFGTLLAMGTDRGQLARLVVLEAVWLGVIGGAIGSILAAIIAFTINSIGIQMPPPPAAVDPLTLLVLIKPTDFLYAIVFMVVLLAIATVPPILKILRLQVVEALSHV